MERIRTEILPGVWLTALRTDKFKTAWLSVNLLTQLRRSTAACTAVLPYVLRRGSTRLPDLETIAAELENLYGASITPSVRKLGEIQAVGFEAEFADDGAVGEEIFPRLAADVADLLLHPNTRGGTFETNDIPQVESCLTCSLGAAVVGEQPLHTGHLVPIAKFIERDVARQYPAAAGAGHVQRFGRFPVELHADHSFGPIGILRRSTFCVGIFLATGEQRQTKNEK